MMDDLVERRVMLTVTHAMTFQTHWGKEALEKSDWFKHPHSTDEFWWQVEADIHNNEAIMSIMVEKERRIFYPLSPRELQIPIIICALEIKVFKKFLRHKMMKRFLLPDTTSYGVYKVPATRKRCKVIKLRFGRIPTELTVVVSFTLLNDANMIQKMILYSIKPPMTVMSSILNFSDHINLSSIEPNVNCDLILEMKDGQVLAHKAILIASSPVFHAMFKHDTMEKRDNKIIIPDLTAEAISEALGFVYSGVVNLDNPVILQELVEVSERYELNQLKLRCECALVQSMYKDDDRWIEDMPGYAMELLSFANMYHMKTLKEASEVALSWHIKERSVDFFMLALDSRSEFLKKFAFERLVVLRHPHFEAAGWKELQDKYPKEVQELLSAQIQAHGSSPGLIRFNRD